MLPFLPVLYLHLLHLLSSTRTSHSCNVLALRLNLEVLLDDPPRLPVNVDEQAERLTVLQDGIPVVLLMPDVPADGRSERRLARG